MATVDLFYDLFVVESERNTKEFDVAVFDAVVGLYDGMTLESVSEPFGTSVKKFFANLITAIRNFINKFKNYVTSTTREASYAATLTAMEKSIRKAKEEGKTKVKMADYDYIRKEYKAMCNDLKSYAKKFVKMRYTSTLDIDRDLAEFMRISDYWDKRMEKSLKKEKTFSIDDAIRFVEGEKRGFTHIFDHLNDSIQQIDEIKHVAEETASRMSTLGSDIIPKHVNFLKRIANTISQKVTKFISKIIAVNVLVFA